MAASIAQWPYKQGEGHSTTKRTCVRKYTVDGTLTDLQTPKAGIPYNYMSDWPGDRYRVTTWRNEAVVRSGGVTVNVMTVHGSTAMAEYQSGQTKRDSIQKGTSHISFRPSASMVGVRQATRQDAGWINDPAYGTEVYKGDVASQPFKDKDGNSITASGDNFRTLCPDGTRANLSSWIFKNASNMMYVGSIETVGANKEPSREPAILARVDSEGDAFETAGSADVTNCPFVDKTDSTVPGFSYAEINLEFRIPVFTLLYYVRTDRYMSRNIPRAANDGIVTDWGPGAGRKYGPPVHSEHPTEDGSWRIVDQSLNQDHDIDGTNIIQVRRTFQRVPYAFSNAKWNPAIYPAWTADW